MEEEKKENVESAENADQVASEQVNEPINQTGEEIIAISDDVVETSTDGLKISNDAVATYAGIAVSEVQGVYGMSGGFAGITEAFSGKKNFSRGIKVDVTEKSAKIDVSIVVEYGARIPDVAFEIQSIVKKSVESMTGLKVQEVNVHVNGVHMQTTESKEEMEETNNIEE